MNAGRFLSVPRSLVEVGRSASLEYAVRRRPAIQSTRPTDLSWCQIIQIFPTNYAAITIKTTYKMRTLTGPIDICQAIVTIRKRNVIIFFHKNGLAQVPRLPQPMALPYMGMGKILSSDW